MAPGQNNVLVVAGMHRSGTSLVTHWLHDCGLQVGESLLEAGLGNVDGHFEDLEFLRLHADILSAGGADGAGLDLESAVAPSAYDKAKMSAVIGIKNAAFAQWGWKDPRTCLFLDTYDELLPQAKYLVVLRDYHAVVGSLIKRDLGAADDKYRARGWLVWQWWRHLRQPRQQRKHSARHAERYLRAWVRYNQMILKTISALPESRYLVLNYHTLQEHSADVFNFLSVGWSFRLRYRHFGTIFKQGLMGKRSSVLPFIRDQALLDEANRLSDSFQSYLRRSGERLAHIATQDLHDWGQTPSGV